MKSVKSFFIVVFICLTVTFLSSCSKDKSIASKGSIKFSLGVSAQQLKSVSVSDTAVTNDSTSSYSALVTILDSNGQIFCSSLKVAMYIIPMC